MSVKTDAELKAQLDGIIKRNGGGEITPELDNSIRTNIIDSKLSIKDGGLVVQNLTGYSSSLTPTDPNHFTNKSYIDTLLEDYVTIADPESITGQKTFTQAILATGGVDVSSGTLSIGTSTAGTVNLGRSASFTTIRGNLLDLIASSIGVTTGATTASFANTSISLSTTTLTLTGTNVIVNGTTTLSDLTALTILELDASKNIISATKNDGYNNSYGTTAGTVLEGSNDALYAKLAGATFTGGVTIPSLTISGSPVSLTGGTTTFSSSSGNIIFDAVSGAVILRTASLSRITIASTGAVTVSTAATFSSTIQVASTISVNTGTSGVYSKVGGTRKVNITPVGNTGTGEDDLITFSLDANSLAASNDFLEIIAFGTFAANANSKRVKMYFGATVIYDSTAQDQNGGDWQITARVIRNGATTQVAFATMDTNGSLFRADTSFNTLYTTPAETLSGAITIKCTGEGVSNSDIEQKGMIVKYNPGN